MAKPSTPKTVPAKPKRKKASGKKQKTAKIVSILKQQLANGENISLHRAFVTAGYSDSTARRGVAVLREGDEAIDFDKLLDKVFPEEELCRIQLEQLGAAQIKTIEFPSALSQDQIVESVSLLGFKILKVSDPIFGKRYATVAVPDWDAINKGLERIWKLKKRLKDATGGVPPTFNIGLILAEIVEKNSKRLPAHAQGQVITLPMPHGQDGSRDHTPQPQQAL